MAAERDCPERKAARRALVQKPCAIEQRKDALKLRDDVLREAKEWADGGRHAESLVRRGERLHAALALATSEDFKSALAPAGEYLKACRKLVVIPAGSYKMGGERSSRIITIKTPFAVSRFAITFDQWDACVAGGGCENNLRPADENWGRGSRPVINVDWRDAQDYVAWLNRMTDTDSYRLLSEAEWEYAARGVTSAQAPHPDYPWGKEIGRANANCDGCGSQWDNKETAPVGSFKDNQFGLYDMAGNIWQWAEDCYQEHYDAEPTDGSAWTTPDCGPRVVRGGSWLYDPEYLRSANRLRITPGIRDNYLGFRVGRTLLPP
jgi:formylglycine-generating enzyme required for sulfatase activity